MVAPTPPAAVEEGPRAILDYDVLQWRYEELERAGYPVDVALTLAGLAEVDLHGACDLLRRGCSVDQALRILT